MNLKHLILISVYCLTPNIISAKSIAYSLEGLLEQSSYIGEVSILQKNEITLKNSLICGYNYEFVSSDFHTDQAKFWSVANLDNGNSYFIILKKPFFEVARINELYERSEQTKKEAIKSDIADCLDHIETQKLTAPPGGIFDMGIIGSKKYVKSDYIIFNDTDYSLDKNVEFNDYCSIDYFLKSEPIKKDCLEMFFKAIKK